ncbi:hypothetical protein EYF80_003228 [Liparis tanakae]|uniref:Uncharacterized protein n=1 Tax=Liparis tanakae TaxID=230148 RepID=A0A4Z2J9V3_9TELE|nr:hypothetical protein EYF80_003228 [Liparis tanakae]
MAKTKSLSSRSSLCSRGGPKRKCEIAARPVLRMTCISQSTTEAPCLLRAADLPSSGRFYLQRLPDLLGQTHGYSFDGPAVLFAEDADGLLQCILSLLQIDSLDCGELLYVQNILTVHCPGLGKLMFLKNGWAFTSAALSARQPSLCFGSLVSSWMAFASSVNLSLYSSSSSCTLLSTSSRFTRSLRARKGDRPAVIS